MIKTNQEEFNDFINNNKDAQFFISMNPFGAKAARDILWNTWYTGQAAYVKNLQLLAYAKAEAADNS